ncbi:MAG TPA: S1C family serine protease [Casimicrobiaceae bacterium]|nr:S1C family serine protease [Casimicrobiaceae bacterium]
MHSSFRFSRTAIALTFALIAVTPASSTPRDASTAPSVAQSDVPGRKAEEAPVAGIDAERLYAALVRVQTIAVPNARSNGTLGREREGTGTVINNDGVILTIGYLLTEADTVKVTDNKGRSYPARVLAQDHATGLGLVKTTVPIKVEPVPLGNSAKLANREPVLIAGWGGIPDTALAYVVSRRPFSANWEYMLDEAIFTSPPTTGWSGAALVDRKGTIVGVGSLVVREATNDDPKLPGNMFVPIDALKPILDDMVRTGRRKGSPRPWLGLAADEVSGRLIVSRVSPEGPAETAGVRNGDIILGVGSDTVKSQSDFYQKLWTRSSAGDVIHLRVLQGVDIREIPVRSINRVDYFRPVTTY